MFRPIRFSKGNVISLPLTADAVATKYGHMKMASGYLVAGAAGDNEAEYIALETKTDLTSVNGRTSVEVIRVQDVIEFEALCGTTPVQATHVGNSYDFGSNVALDLTATTDKVFTISEIINASDKLVRGSFNKPAIA